MESLQALKGAARKARRPRMAAIEKALDKLEAKHARKQLESMMVPVEAPEGVAFLEPQQAKKSSRVVVSDSLGWVKYQCALSFKKAGGKGLPMLFDASDNGKARKRGLGKTGKIMDVDAKDASAEVAIEGGGGGAAWYPIAALSLRSK